jgi:hypothetical protein
MIGNTHIDTKTDGRNLLRKPLRWVQLHNTHTKFHKDWFRYSTVDGGGGYTDTDGRISLLLYFKNKESKLRVLY